MFKEKRGITLIALVVTIVVLLILAGVSIGMLTGENGIIKQAQDSKDKNKIGEIEEKVRLAAQAALIDELGQEIKEDKFQEELDTNFGEGIATLEYDEATRIYTVTVDVYEVLVNDFGKIQNAEESAISMKLILSYTEQIPETSGNVKELTSENVARTDSSLDTNTLVSKKGEYVYTFVDIETSKTLATALRGSNTNVTTQLITGAGWDRVLNWIIETGTKTEEQVMIDSRSWGNYANSTGDAATDSGISNMDYTTGRSEYWKANNIYDLAGNIFEWTPETVDEGIKNNSNKIFEIH